ncbi:MAG: hypothetical protein ACRC5H_10180 [Treponemataceae bacterium]
MKNSIVPVICILTIFSMISCNFNEDDNSPTPTPKPTPKPTWEQVGDVIETDMLSGLHKNLQSLKLIQNTLYVAYSKSGVTVKKLDGAKWQPVGTPLLASTGGLSNLNGDSKGTPYIAVKTSKTEITVHKLVDEKWEQVGSPITTSTDATTPIASLYLDFEGDTPFVAYSNKTASYDLAVQSYNEGGWETVKELPQLPVKNSSFSMISFKDKIYVAYPSTNSEVIVKDSAGTVVGTPIKGKEISNIELFTNKSDLYITYIDDSSVKLYKLTESSWTAISTESIGASEWLSAAIDSKETIYLGGNGSVKKYDGSSWTQSELGLVEYPHLTLKSEDLHILTNTGSGKLVVKKPIN